MQKYQNATQDALGNAIQGMSVSVFNHGTTNLATIFSDNGITSIPNPTTTDAVGSFAFYAANGRYDLQFSKTGLPTTNLNDILFFDPSNGGTGAVTAGQIVFGGAGNTFAQDAGLVWDNTNKRLGINNITPGFALDVSGTIRASISVLTPSLATGSATPLNLANNNGSWNIDGTLYPNADAGQNIGIASKRVANLFVQNIDSGSTGALTLKTNNGTTQAIISNAGVHSLKTQRTTSTNVIALSIDDNATGAQTVGKGAYIQWTSNSGNTAAQIGFEVGGDGTNNQSQISFYTQASAGALTKQLSISSAGAITVPNVSTTASAANAFLDNAASNNLLRSTSSMVYKDRIADLSDADLLVLDQVRPVTYHSTSEADDPERLHYGLLAEDVARYNPNLVTTRKLPILDGVSIDVPDWVQYERFIPLLIEQGRRDRRRIAALEQRLGVN